MGVVNLIDMYPTLVELCGLTGEPTENEGRSFAESYPLVRTWSGVTGLRCRTIGYGGHRIYDGRYSYIVFASKGTEELYDHETDPMEWHNLVSNPEYSKIKARLKSYVPSGRELEHHKINFHQNKIYSLNSFNLVNCLLYYLFVLNLPDLIPHELIALFINY